MSPNLLESREESGNPVVCSVDIQSVGLARASEEARLEHDRTWIANLGQKWRTRHGEDLKLRFDTGKALNDRLGPPTSRLPRGENVMEMLAEESGLSVSMLYRTRWFAYRFATYEGFKASQPDVDTWEKVCVLLVEFSQKEKAAEAASGGSASNGNEPNKKVQTVLRMLNAMAKAMPREQIPVEEVDEDVVDDFDSGLRKFRRAFKRCTGLNVTISIAPATETITS